MNPQCKIKEKTFINNTIYPFLILLVFRVFGKLKKPANSPSSI